MNIEDMQKVNRLAKELLMHHIVDSSEEAVARAEQMIYGRDESKRIVAEKSVEAENHDIRNLQNSVSQISSAVSRLSSEMSILKAEYDKLKSEFINLRQRNFPASPQQPQPQASISSAAAEQQKKNDAEQDRLSEEVAIDKVFYFGKK